MIPFFSVIIPLYNKENYIQGTIQSVFDQQFSDFEIIIVDDGSTDNSAQKVAAINSDRIRLVPQQNQGASVARNRGIEEASGRYIALLDADDYWYPDHLQQLCELIEKFPEAGLYCSGYEIKLSDRAVRKATYSQHLPEKPQPVEDYFLASLVNDVAQTSALAFTKDDFYKIGPFDPGLRTGQDIDFFIRAALTVPVALNPAVTLRYLKKTENNLHRTEFNWDRLGIIEKHRGKESKNPSLKKYMDVFRYALAIRCRVHKDPVYKQVADGIDPKNLNAKQRLLLKCPRPVLKTAISLQQWLMGRNIYWTAYR